MHKQLQLHMCAQIIFHTLAKFWPEAIDSGTVQTHTHLIRENESCEQVALRLCKHQRGAVINKLCDSSCRRHLLCPPTHTRTNTRARQWSQRSLEVYVSWEDGALLRHPSLLFSPFYLLHFFFFTSTCSVESCSHLSFHIYSASLLTLSSSKSHSHPLFLHFQAPQATSLPVADIFSLTGGEKPMEIDACSAPLWAVTWHDGEFSLSSAQQQLFFPYVWCTPSPWNSTNIPPVSRLL